MALLVDSQEEGIVTNYSDIQAASAQFQAAKMLYWQDLVSKALKICRGLEAYLGLKGRKTSLAGSQDEAYLQFGYVDNGKFSPISEQGFKSSGLQVPFVIQLIVEPAPGEWPKQKLLSHLSIGREREAYCVQLEAIKGIQKFHLAASFFDDQVREVYEAIALDMVDSLDISEFKLGSTDNTQR